MTPLVDAARELLKHVDAGGGGDAWQHEEDERQFWAAIETLRAAVTDAEADLARAANVAAGRA